jgi:anti-sigma regulatory factor (Ser/Thr protein kinase)
MPEINEQARIRQQSRACPAIPPANLDRQVIRDYVLTRLSDDVELLVAELVTNAVSASRSLPWPSAVRMWLLSGEASVLVIVGDANPQAPARIDAADDAESGRGLLLVEATSAWWDWYHLPGADGKVIRALITA